MKISKNEILAVICEEINRFSLTDQYRRVYDWAEILEKRETGKPNPQKFCEVETFID